MHVFFCALANSCQVYPSEYAYHEYSVMKNEGQGVSCVMYQSSQNSAPRGYIHCSGTQLKLADSDLGPEIYNKSHCYVWTGDARRQILFIFPIQHNLTAITLYYYSDSYRGLPGLKIFKVPEEFDIWDAPTAVHRFVEVTAIQPGEPASRSNLNIDFNFNTRKVLMHKFGNEMFPFAVSEVQFFTCIGKL